MSTTPPLPPSSATVRVDRPEKGDQPESPILGSPRSDAHSELAAVEGMIIDSEGPGTKRPVARTPEPQMYQDRTNGNKLDTPSTPGHLAPFDWEEFESRYEQALSDANHQEQELLTDFERLVKYFNVWASAASAHDNERAHKRLQTRERYVQIEESNLVQKKKHLSEVVRAFQSALALLSQQ